MRESKGLSHFVYMRLLPNGQIYVGSTNSPPRRDQEHHVGKGCRTTGLLGGGAVIHVEEHLDRGIALRRERQLKGWTKAKKLALAAGQLEVLKLL